MIPFWIFLMILTFPQNQQKIMKSSIWCNFDCHRFLIHFDVCVISHHLLSSLKLNVNHKVMTVFTIHWQSFFHWIYFSLFLLSCFLFVDFFLFSSFFVIENFQFQVTFSRFPLDWRRKNEFVLFRCWFFLFSLFEF